MIIGTCLECAWGCLTSVLFHGRYISNFIFVNIERKYYCTNFSVLMFTLLWQLMEFLSDNNEAAAADVLEFVREAIQRFDNLRPLIVEKMLEVFHAIKSVKWVQNMISNRLWSTWWLTCIECILSLNVYKNPCDPHREWLNLGYFAVEDF